MSELPGNPYEVDANRYATEATLVNDWIPEERQIFADLAQAQATLALAYEQRTASHIAILQMGQTDMSDWPDRSRKRWIANAQRLQERLGGELWP